MTKQLVFREKFAAILVLASVLMLSQQVSALTVPNSDITPGVVCSASDPDFKGYDYPEQIARCNRNVSYSEKAQVARSYGDIPQTNWSNYEFDHLIPLCAGGSNNIKNIWPQPIDQAKQKDVLEVEICTGMRNGTLSQATAVQKVHDWFQALAEERRASESQEEPSLDEQIFEQALSELSQ